MKIEIKPIVYAHSRISERMAFENGSSEKALPIDFIIYYICTQDRHILVDAGCDTLPGFEMRDFIGPVKALNACGIDKNDITDILITHAHHDHIEDVKHFKNATVHIQKDEYVAGKGYIPQQTPVHLFEEEFSLCEGVSMIKIGGHSVGSCIVKVQNNGKTYIICGDECYTGRCLEEKIPTGASVCPAKSKEFVETYGSGDYIPLLCHQSTQFEIE